MKIITSILIFSLIIIGISCTNQLDSLNDIIFPEKNVSFTQHVQPFLRYSCGYSGCHGLSSAGGINLTDYFSIMKVPGLVIPGNPDQSYLIQIIDNRIPHFTYFERSQINSNHIQGMKTWVREGALNN